MTNRNRKTLVSEASNGSNEAELAFRFLHTAKQKTWSQLTVAWFS